MDKVEQSGPEKVDLVAGVSLDHAHGSGSQAMDLKAIFEEIGPQKTDLVAGVSLDHARGSESHTIDLNVPFEEPEPEKTELVSGVSLDHAHGSESQDIDLNVSSEEPRPDETDLVSGVSLDHAHGSDQSQAIDLNVPSGETEPEKTDIVAGLSLDHIAHGSESRAINLNMAFKKMGPASSPVASLGHGHGHGLHDIKSKVACKDWNGHSAFTNFPKNDLDHGHGSVSQGIDLNMIPEETGTEKTNLVAMDLNMASKETGPESSPAASLGHGHGVGSGLHEIKSKVAFKVPGNSTAGKACQQPTEKLGAKVTRRRRGRPMGSKNKPKPPPTAISNCSNGPTACKIDIPKGCDVRKAVETFMHSCHVQGVVVTSGRGAVTNVTLELPAHPGRFAFQGHFQILHMSGAFLPTGAPCCAAGLGVLLQGEQGQLVGGNVVGTLLASGPVVVTAVTF